MKNKATFFFILLLSLSGDVYGDSLFPKEPVLISTKPHVFFKGEVDIGEDVFINNNPVNILDDGSFSYVFTLTEPNSFHRLNVKRLGSNGLIEEEKRDIYYKQFNNKNNKAFSPEIVLHSYKENQLIKGKSVTLTGYVKGAEYVFINEKLTTLENGFFSEEILTNKPGKYTFVIDAVNKEGGHSESTLHMYKVLGLKEEKQVPDLLSSQRISINLVETPLSDVLDILAIKGRFKVSSTLEGADVVNLSLSDVSLWEAIEHILGNKAIDYRFEDNTLLISRANYYNKTTSLKTELIHLDNVDAKVMKEILQAQLSLGEEVKIVPKDNALLLKAKVSNVNQYELLINALEKQPVPKVSIGIQLVEVPKHVLDNEQLKLISESITHEERYLPAQEYVSHKGNLIPAKELFALIKGQKQVRVINAPQVQVSHASSIHVSVRDNAFLLGEHEKNMDNKKPMISLDLSPDLTSNEERIHLSLDIQVFNGEKELFFKASSSLINNGMLVISGFDNPWFKPKKKRSFLSWLFGSKKQESSVLLLVLRPKLIDG